VEFLVELHPLSFYQFSIQPSSLLIIFE